MLKRRLEISCERFDVLKFEEVVAKACGAPWTSAPAQVKYLASYLNAPQCAARTIVVEAPYVDRHYIEEYTAYYATALRAPRRDATRLHFFSESFDREKLVSWLEEAASNDTAHEAIRGRIQDSYLGFSTVRPMPDAPIGRTILRPYKGPQSRLFRPAETLNHVHLLGFELKFNGVPFQQQEQAVGACATTAIWAALASATRAIGGRAPTPYAVTEAATRHAIERRVLPANDGLSLPQMAAAIRATGFEPYFIKSEPAHLFSFVLKTYLASGIPGILLLNEPGAESHAVAAVGYRVDDEEYPAPDLVIDPIRHTKGEAAEASALASAGISRVYVHEDRLGPYARMQWSLPTKGDAGPPSVSYLPYKDSPDSYSDEPQEVYAGFFPLYPKLRLSARGLLTRIGEIYPLLRHLVGREHAGELRVEPSFELGGRYLAQAFRDGMAKGERLAALALNAAFSRYVGVSRFYLGEVPLCDMLFDTTDIIRKSPRHASTIAVLAYDDGYADKIAQYFKGEEADWVLVP